MRFITRPIEKWPRKETRDRKRSPYSVSYDRALRQLERELDNLDARGDIVLQLDVLDREIRQDGLVYATARPRTPRVAIAFTCRHGPLTYYCDRFIEWQANVRAIGLGMERLRLVEDTGIVSRGEQYTGFKALPAGIELGPIAMTVEDAARVVAVLTPHADASQFRLLLENQPLFNSAYREAAKRCHPDAGGKPDDWHRLQQAAAVLEKHHARRSQ